MTRRKLAENVLKRKLSTREWEYLTRNWGAFARDPRRFDGRGVVYSIIYDLAVSANSDTNSENAANAASR